MVPLFYTSCVAVMPPYTTALRFLLVEMVVLQTGWPQTEIFLISASQVAEIINVSLFVYFGL
jgi:hypothetical protein